MSLGTFVHDDLLPAPRESQFELNDLTEEHSSSEALYTTTGPLKYDQSQLSGRIAVGGVYFSILFSLCCIAAGIFIAVHQIPVDQIILLPSSLSHPPTIFVGLFVIFRQQSSTKRELLGLVLNIAVTICTESIGFVHSVALKSALANESRLRFNTNLRLLTAACTDNNTHRWLRSVNFNGTFLNIVMAILLILSYVCSSLVVLPFQPSPGYEPSGVFIDPGNSSWILGAPLTILGTVLLLQSIIALEGAYRTTILTWSPSPFDITVALIDHALLTRYPNRCMHGVRHYNTEDGPRKPCLRQHSAWEAHPSVRKIIILLWSLIPACAVWGGITIAVAIKSGSLKDAEQQPQSTLGSWAFLPNAQTHELAFTLGGDQSFFSWIGALATIAVIQGALTIGLHCSEVIVNVVRDEVAWRRASSKTGLCPSSNPLASVLGNWPNVGLLIAKPILHWMFGLSFNAQGDANEGSGFSEILLCITLCMRPVQIWYLGIALTVFAFGSTIIARYRLYGSQPAAYGHVQVLADLVDEWSPTMWWGHKGQSRSLCHAGTSDHPLPPVKMECLYAGIHPSFSDDIIAGHSI